MGSIHGNSKKDKHYLFAGSDIPGSPEGFQQGLGIPGADLPERRAETCFHREPVAVVEKQDNTAVVPGPDHAAGGLCDFLHAGHLAGQIVSLAQGPFQVFTEQGVFKTDLGESGSHNDDAVKL